MKPKEIPGMLFEACKLKCMRLRSLNDVNKHQLPVVVSLTSIPSRLEKLHYTIRSLMAQSHRPEKILLWLHADLKIKIPKPLAILESNLFEIRYNEFTCSHRKLVHSLEAFPEITLLLAMMMLCTHLIGYSYFIKSTYVTPTRLSLTAAI